MRKPPLTVFVIGAGLLGVAVAYHTREMLVLNQRIGPGTALFLDGFPALVLSYAGYRLDQTRLSEPDLWRTVGWCIAGASVFMSAIGLTFIILIVEGRRIVEPVFLLLVTAEIGGLSGLTAGYYHSRAHADTRRAATVNKAVAFVNDLIRHDLRNDLSVIQGQVDLLSSAEEPSVNASKMGDMSVIEEKTDEALTRIETTRAITETLVRDPEFKPVDLSRITTELADKIEDVFPITVNTRLPEEAFVQANEGLRSVVDNVLENAARHNDADDPRIDVEIETQDDLIILRIRDNGPGIPDDEKQELFDATEGEYEAHGLTIVHTLVDAYGGQISIADNDPRGTLVTIQLPRAVTAESSPTA